MGRHSECNAGSLVVWHPQEQIKVDAYMSAAARKLVCDLAQRRREVQEHDDFLRCKVELARSQMDEGLHFSGGEVVAEFSAKLATEQCKAKPSA